MSNRRTVTEIISIIQKINKSIPDVRYAPNVQDYPNGSLHTLPCVLIYPESGTFSTKIMGDKVKHSRVYLFKVFTGLHDGIQSDVLAETMNLLTEFGFVWAETDVLDYKPELCIDKGEFGYITDSGVLEYMEYGGELYYGFEFRVVIYEKS